MWHSAPAMEGPRVGSLFGRYVVLRQLAPPPGTPGPGRNFLALDRATLEEVVLIVPPAIPATEKLFAESLARARRISSPRLATILAGGWQDGHPYVSYPWVPGVRLAELVPEGGLSTELATRILWDLASALTTLHDNGLAHGDVHPGNIIVPPGGSPMLVGYVPAPYGEPLSTRSDDQKIARHAPPEWHESKVSTPAGDVYSLALVAYQLFTGRPLLPPATAARTHQNQVILQQALDKARKVNAAIPAALDPVLLAMLELDPNRRPSLEMGLSNALLQMMPSWDLSRPLTEVLGERYKKAVQRSRDFLLEEARRALAEGSALGAAQAIKRFAELAPRQADPARPAAIEIVKECFWHTFRLRPETSDEAGWAHGEALSLELLKASLDLEAAGLVSIGRYRLRSFTRQASPLEASLPKPADVARLRSGLPVLKSSLARDPRDEEVLLGLALVTPELGAESASSLHALKAALLTGHGLASAALYHRAQELALRPDDPALLASLRDLATAALGGRSAAAPEQVPVTLSLSGSYQGAAEPAAPAPPPSPDASSSEARQVLSAGLEESGLAPEGAGSAQEAVRGVGVLADADVLFSEGQVLINEGKLAAAAETFRRLVEAGALQDEHYHAVVIKELRRMLWSGLCEHRTTKGHRDLFRKIVDLARALALTDILPICEHLVRWAEGDPVPYEPPPAGWDQARAELRFQTVEAEQVKGRDLGSALWACEEFVRSDPEYLPAYDRAAQLALRAKDPLRAARLHLAAAELSLRRGMSDRARKSFRDALNAEPANLEALLYLATLVPDGRIKATDPMLFRLELLAHEGLHKAAVSLGRKALRGGPKDMPLHKALIDLCREAGDDPSPHLLAYGHWSLQEGDEIVARNCFEEAQREARSRGTVLTQHM